MSTTLVPAKAGNGFQLPRERREEGREEVPGEAGINAGIRR